MPRNVCEDIRTYLTGTADVTDVIDTAGMNGITTGTGPDPVYER